MKISDVTLALIRRREDALAGQAPAQWLPKPATSQLPHKRHALGATWSPEERVEQAARLLISRCRIAGAASSFVLFVAFWLALACGVKAQTSDFTYSTTNGTVTITGYSGSGGTVVIPDNIDGNPVTLIGFEAFSGNTSITDVAMGNSVTGIGESAFNGCSSLTNVTIPESVTYIGPAAFYNCTGLGDLMLGNNVTSIDYLAFYNCSGLGSVVIGNGVTNVDDGAFGNCTGLTNLVLGSSIVNIGNSTFSQCTGLNNLNIPNSVTRIADQAFEDCSSLSNLMLGVGVTNIGAGAFDGCASLPSVNIPASVTFIGHSAFLACTSMTNIAVDSSNAHYNGVGGVLFDKPIANLIQCPGGLAGNYTIPASVTNIGQFAFSGCALLTSATVSANVTSIQRYAFSSCSGLSGAYFEGNAPIVNGGPGSSDTTVFSGATGVAYYLPGTMGWGATFGGLPTALWYQANPVILGKGSGMGLQNNLFGFTVSWATNGNVVVLATTNLPQPVWETVTTGTLTNGVFNFQDIQSTNFPQRFYKVQPQ